MNEGFLVIAIRNMLLTRLKIIFRLNEWRFLCGRRGFHSQ